jgi:hypothetical protein
MRYLIEDKIDDYLSDGMDEGFIGSSVKIGWYNFVKTMADKKLRIASEKDLEAIDYIMKKNKKGELEPDLERQLKELDKRLEFYKLEFVKILMKLEKIADEIKRREDEEEEEKDSILNKYDR